MFALHRYIFSVFGIYHLWSAQARDIHDLIFEVWDICTCWRNPWFTQTRPALVRYIHGLSFALSRSIWGIYGLYLHTELFSIPCHFQQTLCSLSRVGRACSTQQHAYGSPSEAQLEGCPSQIFFGLCAEFFVPEACWRKAESLKSSHQTSCRCAQWSMPWFHGKYVMSNFKCFWLLEINIFTDSVSVLTLCCWPWSPQYQLLIWASASSITGINYLLTIIDSEAWFFCLADKAHVVAAGQREGLNWHSGLRAATTWRLHFLQRRCQAPSLSTSQRRWAQRLSTRWRQAQSSKNTEFQRRIWKVGICYITYISCYVPPLLRNKTIQHI